MSYLYQAAGKLGFVIHLPDDLNRRFSYHGRMDSGVLHGTRRSPWRTSGVASVHVDCFLLQTVYQIALWSPSRLVKRTNIGKLTYAPKIIAVSAVDRSQNSTQPSKSMPLSNELKSSLPDPAPDREHELDAVLPEMPPGAPRGYSM